MRVRADENRAKLWLLLRANRLLVAGLVTVVVFVAFVAIETALSPSLAVKTEAKDPIETLFSAMITAIVTGATLVVTIGQLVLTQENGPLGDQQERMNSTLAVRDSVAELTGSPAPTDPAEFLDALLGAASRRARGLRESVRKHHADSPNAPLWDDVDDLTAGVVENADTVRDRLDGAEFGSFDVVFASLDFNYSRKIGRIERIADDHDEALTDGERDLLMELKESLSLFGPVREHVKTLYFQWVLIDLSRLILYAAVPALIVASAMVAIVDVGTFPEHSRCRPRDARRRGRVRSHAHPLLAFRLLRAPRAHAREADARHRTVGAARLEVNGRSCRRLRRPLLAVPPPERPCGRPDQ